MPVVKVEISKTTKEKKAEMIKRLTKTMSEITNIPEQAFTVYINEYEGDNIGVGGTALSDMHR